MIRMLVSRCHVSDSNREVVDYVTSCLQPSAWGRFSSIAKRRIIRACIEEHRKNKELYAFVMS